MTTQQPEALRLAGLLELAPEDGVEPQTTEDAAAELRRQHARIAELESIGAGGVSGPLMGQPQAPLGGRWYMMTHDGAATLCIDQEDAQAEAVKADRNWPHTAPHRAVQLVEVADVEALRTGYAAARLEIESLQARIKTMAEEHADELMVAHLDGMRAAQPAGAANTRAQENVALLAEILNHRPAMNAGLTQAYAAWTAEVYDLMGAIAAEPANEDRAQAAPVAVAGPIETHEAMCPALTGDRCTCERNDPAVDKAWARFCGRIGDGPDAPYPGMIPAFERYYSQSFTDKDWRNEASVWAAAWKQAMLAAAPTTQPAPQQEAQEPVALIRQLVEALEYSSPHTDREYQWSPKDWIKRRADAITEPPRVSRRPVGLS